MTAHQSDLPALLVVNTHTLEEEKNRKTKRTKLVRWCNGGLFDTPQQQQSLTLGKVEKPERCAGAELFLSGVIARSELLLLSE